MKSLPHLEPRVGTLGERRTVFGWPTVGRFALFTGYSSRVGQRIQGWETVPHHRLAATSLASL